MVFWLGLYSLVQLPTCNLTCLLFTVIKHWSPTRVRFNRSGHRFGLGLSRVGWIGFELLFCWLVWVWVAWKNMGFIYFLHPTICSSTSRYLTNANGCAIRIPTLLYKYPRYYRHTLTVKWLVICELLEKLSGSLGVDHNGVDSTTSEILNKVTFGVNTRSIVINHT